MKHLRTEVPEDPALRQINFYGFQLFVESGIVRPETWNVKLRRFPHQHIDVLWNGNQTGGAVSPSGLYPDGPNPQPRSRTLLFRAR